MADILTLAQARSALNWPAGSHMGDESDLSAIYIPATTEVLSARYTIPATVPQSVVIVAKRVLSRLWNSDHQGIAGRPDGTAPPTDLTEGDLLLLQPYRTLGGFA